MNKTIHIEKYRWSELDAFIHSDKYKQLKTKPISEARAVSYLNNPRAKEEDYIMYLAYIDGEIAGFRTLLPDTIFYQNKEWHFAWLSGNWVEEQHRRKGISSTLFEEVYSDWKGMLAYNDVAPNSQKLFSKTNLFTGQCEKKGVRIYLKPTIYNLLKNRVRFVARNKRLVKFVEKMISLVLVPYKITIASVLKKNLKNVSVYYKLNEEIQAFINQNPQNYFRRQSIEYKWILKYPWVQKNPEIIAYPFSYRCQKLQTAFLVTRNSEQKIDSLAMVKNYDGKVSVPYFVSPKKPKALFKAIQAWTHAQKADYATFYKQDMTDVLSRMRCVALFRKKLIRYMDVTKTLSKTTGLDGENPYQQDGDGDSIFT